MKTLSYILFVLGLFALLITLFMFVLMLGAEIQLFVNYEIYPVRLHQTIAFGVISTALLVASGVARYHYEKGE